MNLRPVAAVLAAAAAAVTLAGCGQDIVGVGGGQILEFDNDLHRPVTFLYCPLQGCRRPLTREVRPGGSWRQANETLNDGGAVSLQLGRRLTGCRLVEAVGVLVDPLKVYQASYIEGGPACVRP